MPGKRRRCGGSRPPPPRGGGRTHDTRLGDRTHGTGNACASGLHRYATFLHGPRTSWKARGPSTTADGRRTEPSRISDTEMSMCAIRGLSFRPEWRIPTPPSPHAGNRGRERTCHPANDNGPGDAARIVGMRSLFIAAAWRLILGAGCIGLIAAGTGLVANSLSLS